MNCDNRLERLNRYVVYAGSFCLSHPKLILCDSISTIKLLLWFCSSVFNCWKLQTSLELYFVTKIVCLTYPSQVNFILNNPSGGFLYNNTTSSILKSSIWIRRNSPKNLLTYKYNGINLRKSSRGGVPLTGQTDML